MAVSIEDIKKLRHMTGAGMMDCKNALAETEGNIEAAIEIIRKKGQAVAAKREDRQAAEGCVLAGAKPGFAAIVALNCETDFVAKNESFRALTKAILDKAVEAEAKSLEEVKALDLNGRTVAENITDEIGKTGEKMELGAYEYVQAPSVTAYEHLGNKLATIVGLSVEGIDPYVGKEIAMQVAAMNPIAVDRDSVPAEVIEQERTVAIEKTKEEQVKKAVEAAIKKAGINPNLVDSEDHIASNIAKGWLTEEEAEKARAIAAEVGPAKAANLPAAMIENIATGRVNKFLKETVLMEQEYHRDAKMTVADYLNSVEKGLVVVSFKRVNLNED
ncbi:MAG: translation elongation factor Ts [Muribaculaceae bacterium]|nr:translation elongation factor Ts [Muribaculaceae bacterium]MDE7080625.1 translation elongation factor Ts [Muribaculaceae bacterium]